MSAHAGGMCMSRCAHRRILLSGFPVPRMGKSDAGESLHLRQKRTVIILELPAFSFRPKAHDFRAFSLHGHKKAAAAGSFPQRHLCFSGVPGTPLPDKLFSQRGIVQFESVSSAAGKTAFSHGISMPAPVDTAFFK